MAVDDVVVLMLTLTLYGWRAGRYQLVDGACVRSVNFDVITNKDLGRIFGKSEFSNTNTKQEPSDGGETKKAAVVVPATKTRKEKQDKKRKEKKNRQCRFSRLSKDALAAL